MEVHRMGTKLGRVLLLTAAAYFMATLDALVVVTALPRIGASLHGGLDSLQWTVNSYAIAVAAGIITAAALGDRLGRRRVFVVGTLLFTLASAICGLAGSLGLLIVARAVQGLGGAVMITLSLTILTDAFPPERRGAVVGMYGGLGGLAVATGPLIGGAVIQGLSWHWIFWINVPIGAVVSLLASRLLPETRGPAERLDGTGLALVSVGSVSFIWGLVQSGTSGWSSAEVLVTLAAGLTLLAGFVAWERRARAPMIPLSLFRNRGFAAGSVTLFLMSGSIFAAAFLIIQYVQISRGYSPVMTGVRLLPWLLTPMFVAPVAGALGDRIGPRKLISGGLALQALTLGWIALRASHGISYVELAAALALAGVGISLALPTAPVAVLSAAPPDQLGKASGVANTMQRFGAVFAIAIASAVFSGSGSLASPAAVVAGFGPALAVCAGLSALGALTAALIPTTRRPLSSSAGVSIHDRRVPASA
jgi:EmrB/QacA subfamily drug resistance transporter